MSSLAHGDMNIQAADDFTVPEGQTWEIHALRFIGGHFDCWAGASIEDFSVNVFIYEDEASLPGTPVASFNNLEHFLSDGARAVNLNDPVSLSSGVYWVSYQWDTGDTNCDVGVRTRERQTGNPYSWQHGGYLPGIEGCVTWGIGMECNDVAYDPNLHPDLAFALYDEHLLMPSEVPTLSQMGLAAFAGILLILSIIIHVRLKRSVN